MARETCKSCRWYQSEVTETVVKLNGYTQTETEFRHLCCREPGCFSQRGDDTMTQEAPLACLNLEPVE
jgi:hypothetical protein